MKEKIKKLFVSICKGIGLLILLLVVYYGLFMTLFLCVPVIFSMAFKVSGAYLSIFDLSKYLSISFSSITFIIITNSEGFDNKTKKID